jgi:hypothetical protein
MPASADRPLTSDERRLARRMLERGGPEARSFLPQLDLAEATPYRCPCGCATIHFRIKGRPEAPPGVHVLAEFVFGNSDAEASGIMIYESGGTLSALEVYGGAGEAPRSLPSPESLRPFPRTPAV